MIDPKEMMEEEPIEEEPTIEPESSKIYKLYIAFDNAQMVETEFTTWIGVMKYLDNLPYIPEVQDIILQTKFKTKDEA